MATKAAAQKPNLAAELAKATGVSEKDVAKVLDKLGLSAAVKNVASLGTDASAKVSLKNAKLAFRVGRNGLVV